MPENLNLDELAMQCITSPEDIKERIKLGEADFKVVTMASLTSAAIACRYFDKQMSDTLYHLICELVRRHPDIENDAGPPPPLMRD